MEFKHFFHQHKLNYREVSNYEDRKYYYCIGCLDIIYGPAFVCNICHGFAMHKSCAELPLQIQIKSFHPHPLRFSIAEVIVCDGCAKLSAGFITYRCMYCTFNLDFKCALSISNDYDRLPPNRDALHDKDRPIKTKINHFSHNHQLMRCKFPSFATEIDKEVFRKLWGSGESKCMACKQEVRTLHGTLVYTCIPCRFLLHESCVNDMPTQVLRNPFHPQHILLARPIRKGYYGRCSVCRENVEGIAFRCEQCDEYKNLHVCCAKYRTRAIKHNCHPHHLLHLGKSIMSDVSCKVCDERCNDSFFGCIKCEFYIHVECIPLPPRVEHKRHLHPLKLTSPFVEDDSGVYYCDTCERTRNGEHHVYYCEECKYIAHIGCALHEVEDKEEMFLDQGIEENSDEEETADNKRLELIVQNHEKELVQTIQKDVFHPHPLTLNNEVDVYLCNGCGELFRGPSYNCLQCLFNLDIRCAALNDDLARSVAKKGREIIATTYHFSHNHNLTRCKINRFFAITKDNELLDMGVACNACKQDLYGLVYACLDCGFVLHESCLEDMPMEVLQSPFHPQHPLLVNQLPVAPGDGTDQCDACGEKIYNIMFACAQCGVRQHCSCAMYQTRKIKHNCHTDHHLLHLGKKIFARKSPRCNACRERCSNTLFGCIGCKFYMHLECIPLPATVKHVRHLHPLTLTSSVVEDDFGEYYCDICETSRNPEHDVYYCKECTFVAHIDCVLSEVEPPQEILEFLEIPRPKRKPRRRRRKVTNTREIE